MTDFIIYVDMDGVVADFDGGLQEMAHVEPAAQGTRDYKKVKEMWDAVSKVPNFYDKLSPIQGTVEVVKSLFDRYGNRVQMLTGIPRPDSIPTAAQDKENWAKRIINPDVTVNAVMRRDKPKFCTGPECILIDDYEKNIREWEEIGGTGILYKNPEQLREDLQYIINQ